jgi:16S rRNA (cytidine1402-2'-O)-methyltransferase
MTFRALKVLREADIVLAEDTRKTIILLKHYSIQTHLESYHKFNEHKNTERIIERISEGKTVALVSDAGTPGISDPGFLLVRNCIEKGIDVECLPGATALIPAIINSGLPCDRFCFEGFLPQKKGRQKKIAQLADEERTMVFYESPYRTLKCLEQFAEFFGEDRRISVSRELSKIHEETINGTLAEVIAHFKATEPKGEIVIVVEGKRTKQLKTND